MKYNTEAFLKKRGFYGYGHLYFNEASLRRIPFIGKPMCNSGILLKKDQTSVLKKIAQKRKAGFIKV